MINKNAEERFDQGVMLLETGQPREALPFLKAAIDLAREGGMPASRRSARYVSFYGLALCRTRSSVHEALRSCRSAAKLNDIDPDVWCNLGRVAAFAGKRAEAWRAWHRGLSLDPGHHGIRAELRRLGLRRRPVVRFLHRSHPVNVTLGRMRHRLVRGRRTAV